MKYGNMHGKTNATVRNMISFHVMCTFEFKTVLVILNLVTDIFDHMHGMCPFLSYILQVIL